MRRLFSNGFFTLVLLSVLAAPAAAQEVSDPLEPVNRAVFWFNDQLDIYVLEPIARGYDEVTPQPVKHSVTNFFRNLASPIYMASNLVQLKADRFLISFTRFLVNSTIGVGGLFDPASSMNLPYRYDDLGTALGYWGVPPGPFLVVPIVGPYNFRDGFGAIADSFASPIYYINYTNADSDTKLAVTVGARLAQGIDRRARNIKNIETAKEASLDYYGFTRKAYSQHRQGLIERDRPRDEFADDFDDDLDDDLGDDLESPDPAEEVID